MKLRNQWKWKGDQATGEQEMLKTVLQKSNPKQKFILLYQVSCVLRKSTTHLLQKLSMFLLKELILSIVHQVKRLYVDLNVIENPQEGSFNLSGNI